MTENMYLTPLRETLQFPCSTAQAEKAARPLLGVAPISIHVDPALRGLQRMEETGKPQGVLAEPNLAGAAETPEK
jgi:hypothetical protein